LASWLSNGIRLPLVLGAAALIAYALFFASPYDLRVLTICGIYALLVLGFQFVFGHAGAVSLAQATFFGIGGYITGILATRFGFPFLATFPLSIAGPALLAVIIAVPVLKLEEHYFSLATLGIGLVVLLLAIQWSDVTGGTNGLAGIPAIELPGWSIADRRSVLWLADGHLPDHDRDRRTHPHRRRDPRRNPDRLFARMVSRARKLLHDRLRNGCTRRLDHGPLWTGRRP
jgi:ABC-type branched-subunit amino acid transport system permease subunit